MTRMKDSGIEWIGEVPEEWGITKLKYICRMQSGNNLTSLEISSENDGGKIFPVYGGNGQRGYYSDFTNEGNYCLVGRQGALAGNVHFVSGKFWATDHAIVVYEHTHTYSKYLCYLLKAMNLNQYAFETSAQPGLSVEKILQLEMIHCPKGEQTQIADFLDKKVAQLDEVKSLLEEQIKTLEDYRRSLIYETVTKGLDKTVPLKDSGVDWIGQIPEGWEVKHFKYVATIKDGTHDTPEYFVEGVPLITSKNLDSVQNRIDFDSAKNISYDDHIKISQRSDVKKGDILMPMIGTVGGATQVLVEKEFSIKNVALFKVAHDEVLSRFLYYQLNSRWTNSQLSFMMSGGVQSFVSLNMLSKVKLIIPTSEEIKKINLFLDSSVGKINQMIAIKKDQIENINKQRQTLIYDYVTGKRKV